MQPEQAPRAEFVGVDDVAALMGLSESTVRRLSDLPFYKFGGTRRYLLSDLTEYIESVRQEDAAARQ